MESIGRLAGGVAHDFNNILSIILGYGEVLLGRLERGSDDWDRVNEMVDAARRAAGLTRQLLAFSRKQAMQPVVLNLNEVVANLQKMLVRLIGEDIEMKLLLADTVAPVLADPGQVEQILMNLAVNARDAMPEGGQLTIRTGNTEIDEAYAKAHAGVVSGEYVMITVSDTGCGMDSEVLRHIFEPFYTTKPEGKGTGLGLATVYGIVRQSGGHVHTYSEPGKGSTFRIYLPRTMAVPTEQAESRPECPVTGAGEHILVVEDEPALRGLLEEVLEEQGYRVSMATNGGEALLMIESNGLRPDLLVTDVVMPVMTGPELAKRLLQLRPGLKVLYMSGYTDDTVSRQGDLRLGAGFIEKPFSVTVLTQTVRRVLGGGG